jgi:hypothetical protein
MTSTSLTRRVPGPPAPAARPAAPWRAAGCGAGSPAAVDRRALRGALVPPGLSARRSKLIASADMDLPSAAACTRSCSCSSGGRFRTCSSAMGPRQSQSGTRRLPTGLAIVSTTTSCPRRMIGSKNRPCAARDPAQPCGELAGPRRRRADSYYRSRPPPRRATSGRNGRRRS